MDANQDTHKDAAAAAAAGGLRATHAQLASPFVNPDDERAGRSRSSNSNSNRNSSSSSRSKSPAALAPVSTSASPEKEKNSAAPSPSLVASVAAADDHSAGPSIPCPPSPRLAPISRLGSTVSSLAGSRCLSPPPPPPLTEPKAADAASTGRSSHSRHHDIVTQAMGSHAIGMQPDNQALIHMLSLVGSRFLEAEGNGMLTAGGFEDENGDDIDVSSSSGGGDVASRLPYGDDTENVASTAGSPSRHGEASTSSLSRHAHREPTAPNTLQSKLLASVMDDQATPRGSSTPMGASVLHAAANASQKPRESDALTDATPAAKPGTAHDEVCPRDDPSTSSASSTSGTDQHLSIHALSLHARDGDPEAGSADEAAAAADATTDEPMASSAGELARSTAQDSLSLRLRRLFDLDESETVTSCHTCWLFRGIMLQGYLYVMTSHICFYAYLPSRQEQVLRAGILRKRTRHTHRFSKHWAVLRGRSLSWYESETDPFFPQDHIDLRNVMDVGPIGIANAAADAQFEVRTPHRTYLFEVDTNTSRDVWITTLRRAIFRAQNEGDSVRICIPFEAIVDIEGNDAAALSGIAGFVQSMSSNNGGGQATASTDTHDMIGVKVLQAAPGDADYALDEYFFVVDGSATFQEKVRQSLKDFSRQGRDEEDGDRENFVLRTAAVPPAVRDSTQAFSSPAARPLPIPRIRHSAPSAPSGLEGELADASTTALDTEAQLSTSARTLRTSEMAYPPSPTSEMRRSTLPVERQGSVASLLSSTGRGICALADRLPRRLVQETWSRSSSRSCSQTRSRSVSLSSASDEALSGSEALSTFSLLDREADPADDEALSDFRTSFSLPDGEQLMGHVKANLYRVLPVAGRLFVSSNYVCFRSSNFPTKAIGRTLMVLPRSEIISVAKNIAFQYGLQGLVIIIRGHEEIFFEFASTQRRDQCISLLEYRRSVERRSTTEAALREPLLLTDLGNVQDERPSHASLSPHPDSASSMQGSTSSFLPSKPREHLHFTFLTVGSRGDVQPYIGLARGLQREGHIVRIATHPEFRDWIEQYGIEFRGVGGDPAELMRICVENGTFTVAFVRESVTRFRGWLDDLLVSCWEACQGTDAIIESPSAIAGIHVAEALGVPYYRAFTMPWTRTRAYPHAFAVPTRRAGGNYNYMSYVIFDQVFWRASAGQINAWRRRVLRLKATSLDRLEAHKVPFLYNFSPSLVPKPLDWYDWIHVTGYWFLDQADESNQNSGWTPPRALVDFIASARQRQRKLVYIGWGSIVVADAEAVMRVVLEAVQQSGVCAILSRGWSERLSDKQGQAGDSTSDDELQRSVFMVDSIPHGWLFPQLDAACHHGGSGTLGASLRAGVPTIVRPYFGDQFFWASQVESLNVGKCLSHPFTADEFANALTTCTTDARIRENARALGRRIADEDGVGTAIHAIYADWDYACSRISRNAASRAELPKSLRAQDDDTAAVSKSIPEVPRLAPTGPTEPSNTNDDDDDDDNDDDDNDDNDNDDDARSLDEWSVVSGSEGDGA